MIVPVIAGLVIGIGVVILFGLNPNFFPPSHWDYQTAVISLERVPCYGTCPYYSLTIFGNGTVIYEGRSNVAVVGKHTYSVPKENAEHLINYFQLYGFFSMKDSYGTCGDCPTYTTSIRLDEKTKTVVYNGYSAPDRLNFLDKQIDSLANSYDWVECPAGKQLASRDAGGCNPIREHEGLNGKTPAEAANIKIEGANKWMTIIQNAAHEKQQS